MAAMIDGRTLSGDVETDVCVIGAGAAGISVALELSNAPFEVLLVEAGGLQLNPDYQDLYRSAQVGLKTDTLEHNRWRVFGGTTGHWGGWCRPFDPIDFETRPWVPHSGWPISREALDPYYRRASELCQVDWSYDPKTHTLPDDDARGLLQYDEHFENMVFQVSPPTRFGTTYKDALEQSKNTRVLLHSSVVDFDLDESKSVVTTAKVKTLKGPAFDIRAKRFVLAIGAVETARVLLGADREHPQGLGNEHDLVGRYFMQHLDLRKLRWIAGSPDARGRFKRVAQGDHARIAVRVAPTAQREHELLNEHFLVGGFSDTGTDGVVQAAKNAYKARRDLSAVDRAVQRLMLDVDADVHRGADDTVYFADILERPEQAPNPDSRIMLSDERDALGQRRTVMDWRLTELDRRSMLKVQALTAQYLGSRGLGRVRGWVDGFDPTQQGDFIHGGHHHMGTARMGIDPRRSVVDPECRIHGIRNLWVVGGATFPTSGYANPTLTIVAMAVRLAARLRTSV